MKKFNWDRQEESNEESEMKIVFISDVHGVPSTLEAALAEAEQLGYDRIVLLGDLLYHGPRNGVPNFYDPVKVAELLNPLADRIVAVRGNCDAEVDQMMLKFPMMGDYAVLDAGNEQFFLTHGHLWNEDRLPPLGMGTVLAHGHTHIPELKKLACGLTIFNPGSISLPKGGCGRTFGYFDGVALRHIPLAAQLALAFYDKPVRRWLANRRASQTTEEINEKDKEK